MLLRKLDPAPLKQVRLAGPFWEKRLKINRDRTLAVQHDQCRRTGRIDAFNLDWKPGDPNPPHEFWDSDVAKWIEAAAYSLTTHPDAALKDAVTDAIQRIASAQQRDGYLNTHYTVVEPTKRWTNLKDGHEMYCAGHMMEAAVAWLEATGDRTLLDVMARMAEHIYARFGSEDGKIRGYCGHPEIELALLKLARATHHERYAQLAKYFVDERGREPHFFDAELKATGRKNWEHDAHRYLHYQAHKPLREQKDLDGHAVRALYLLAGAIDVAAETDDRALLKTCLNLFRSATQRRMYVTGGVGSRRAGEMFTYDYDLPNETAYAETCAAISLVFVAHRLLQIHPSNEFGDVMERALYNGIPSGVSLSGDRFRYANPLAIHDEAQDPAVHEHCAANRGEWFGCSCCPPNVARLFASLGHYAYSTSAKNAYVHLYAEGEFAFSIGATGVTISQKTNYPWDEKIDITVDPESPIKFAIHLRLPGWCKNPSLKVNGKSHAIAATNGYVKIAREWSPGDRISLVLPMPVQRLHTHPASRNNVGKVALQRGPVVYCLEQADNGEHLHNLILPENASIQAKFDSKFLGGVTVLSAKGKRIDVPKNAALYGTAIPKTKPANLKFIPYCVWGNRKVGEMLVWVRS